MVKFTSTVIAASLFAGSALAAPTFSGSNNVAVSTREIEALFGREMVEYATRSPHHLKEVLHAVDTVNNIVNSRREYESELEARDHTHGGNNHAHSHHNGEHPHHQHPHHQHPQATADAPVDAPATPVADPGTNQRREYFMARDHTHGGNNHAHSHHNGEHPHHQHPHHQHPQATADAPVDAPATPVADPGTNQRREYFVARDHTHGGNNHAHSHHNGEHPHHQHPHHQHPQATADAPVDAPATPVADPGTNQRRSYDDYYGSFVARDGTDGAVDASASGASTPAAPVVHHHQHPHQHPVHGNPEAMRHWHDVISKMRAKQQEAGGHHVHHGQHMHTGPHAHPHSHSASAPVAPVADAAAPVNPPPSRRGLDADELYARYFDFDELD